MGRDTWAGGFQHFWLKGRNKGIASELGDYIPEHIAAREGKFGLNPNREKSYAYHLDAALYANFLRTIAEQNDASRISGTIIDVNLNAHSGYIESLQLDSGELVDGDFFIDCSGFRGLLIERALHTSYQQFSQWMLCDRAVAVQTQSLKDPVPYTRSVARPFGWQWQIPLQNRMGNGLVFSSNYLSDEQARDLLLANIEGEILNEPRIIPFNAGFRPCQWHKNCVAVGLSGGFIEPLESTGIHLFQQAIIRLLQFFPVNGVHQSDIDDFNSKAEDEIKKIADFIILHYHLTEREDSKFWRHCKNMAITSSLKHRIEMFTHSARVPRSPGQLFREDSWVQVMLGQGLQPQHYHPVVDRLADEDLENFLRDIQQGVRKNRKLAEPRGFHSAVLFRKYMI